MPEQLRYLMHTKDLGTWGEQLVRAQVIKRGLGCYVSIGDNTKVDLIVERENGCLVKIQIKTISRSSKDTEMTTFRMRSTGPNYNYTYLSSDVDWFAVVDVKTEKIAWISIGLLEANGANGTSGLALRHSPAKNNQQKRIHWFDDYTEFPF